MLDGRDFFVVGERDGKSTGAWPGRDGAKAVAQQLAQRSGEPVCWTLPPPEAKDVREWLRQKVSAGLDPANADAMRAAGAELLTALKAAAKEVKPDRRSQADALVDLSREHYRLGLSADAEPFAVPVEGPAVALMFRGSGSALRPALAKLYRQTTGRTPRGASLGDALLALEGMARDAEPEPVALRLAEHDDGAIVLDLGDASGRAVLVRPDGWTVEEVSPVLFRRTALTSPLPEPITADAAELAELRKLLNVDDDSWPLVLGYLVASLIPGIPHPILMLGGEQGTGKTTAARVLAALIDPSPAPTRSEPRDPEQWAIASSGSWVVVIDNVSHIAAWFSDALCKAVTGDGLVRRKLYTDSDLAVLAFKRCIILTSIDPGAMRGDLGDRLVLVDLTRIQDKDRRTEAELHATYERARPRLLGALLSVLSRTLAELPNVKLATMPRMADFAQVLAALDRACPELTGGRALDLFVGQRQRIAGEVVESDAVAAAVLRLMESRGRWSGTSGELLTALTPERAPKGWPTSPRGMSGYLRRIVPALRALGVEVQFTRSSDGRRSRLIEIEKRQERPSEPPEASENMADVGETAAHRGPTDTKAEDAVRPLADRPAGNGDGSGPQDGLDGSDGFCHGIPVTDDGRQRGWV